MQMYRGHYKHISNLRRCDPPERVLVRFSQSLHESKAAQTVKQCPLCGLPAGLRHLGNGSADSLHYSDSLPHLHLLRVYDTLRNVFNNVNGSSDDNVRGF